MALAAAATGTQTVSTTLTTLNTTSFTASGVYQMRLDLTNIVNGDEIEVIVNTKTLTGGSEAVHSRYRFLHAQGPKVWDSIPIASLYSISFTVQKIAGTDRSVPWAVLTL